MKILFIFLLSFNSYATYLKLLPKARLDAKEMDGELIHHNFYSLNYSEDHEQARWAMYKLEKSMLKSVAKRTDDFREDPRVSSYSASPKDYYTSGYDRGHLVPAGSMKFSWEAMSESFFMSNMAPQHPGLNRRLWVKLEDQVRQWARTHNDVYVVSGPVLESGLKKIRGEISIPKYFYKIIYRDGNKESMIAFLFPNIAAQGAITDYIVPVDEIEKLTGIDFFVSLSNKTEKKFETERNVADWDFY